MKKEINPAVAVAVVALIVIIVGAVFWVSANREAKAPPMASGPIKLPPSQVGTKLGNQVLGNEVQAPGTNK